MRSVQPGAHQVTASGPASSWVLRCLMPGLLGSQRGITLPEAACAHCSSCQCQLGTDQPSLPRSMCHTSWVPAAEGLCPLPTTAPWQLFQALALAAPFHVFAQALWPGSVIEEPSFPLVVLSGAEHPQGSVPTFPSMVLGDCIFGIKSELYLHPWRIYGLWSWLGSASASHSCASWPRCLQV